MIDEDGLPGLLDATPSPDAFLPARAPRPASARRLLVIDPCGVHHRRFDDLDQILRPGDLLVLNDAATLPASLRGTLRGAPVELRLASADPWTAVILGAGDWHQDTNDRPPPPVNVGDVVVLDSMRATVTALSHGRLLALRFDRRGADLWRAIYAAGRPVQYKHQAATLDLWDVQTPYGGAPWAVEAPSAGFGLSWPRLRALQRAGVGLATVTHAAGLSTTGDPDLDALLPLPERSRVPQATVDAVAACRGRIVAGGTSVARALESNAARHGGTLVAEDATATLHLGPETRRQIVGGLLTGMHDPTESHYRLLQAFLARPVLERAWAEASLQGYLGHEFGDAALLLPGGCE